MIEGDVHALSMLPYHSEKVCDNGWAMVGDAAGFIDPLYSPGLDFCSYTSYYVADLLARSLAGEDVTEQLRHYNEQYPVTYRSWFESLYKDKYYYMGDAELMSSGAAARCEQLLHRLGTSSLSRPGMCISQPAVYGQGRQIRSQGHAFLWPTSGNTGEPKMGDGLLRKKKCWLA